MLLVELGPLVGRLNAPCKQALEDAVRLCVVRGHYEIAIEHLLVKLVELAQIDVALMLRRHDVETGLLKREIDKSLDAMPAGNTGNPAFSPLLLELLQDAWLIASVNFDEAHIRSASVLFAYLARNAHYGRAEQASILRSLNRNALQQAFNEARFASIEEPAGARAAQGNEGELNGAPSGAERGAIARFCEDVTEKARLGKIDPVFGRDAEIRQMIDILARRRKNNPICVGEPGVGKTAVVEGLALRIVHGDVPSALKGVRIVALDMGLLQAGASVKGEFENRLKSVITEIKSSSVPVVLFVDEAHMLIGAGSAPGTSDAANLLKPVLARGELRTIAATTWSEYKKYFEKDAALSRRFQLVKLEEPSPEVAVMILRGLKERYEEAHEVVVLDDAIVAAAQLSSRYISGRYLPDKAVDLLDTACARVKVLQCAKPDVLEDVERNMAALLREKAGLERDRESLQPVSQARIDEIEQRLSRLSTESQVIARSWRNQHEAAQVLLAARAAQRQAKVVQALPHELAVLADRVREATDAFKAAQGDQPFVRVDVDPDVIAKVISDWTGIPVGKMLSDRAQTVMTLAKTLSARIHGQPSALHQIAECIKAASAGLSEKCRPLGVFLLVGPSGVGKTETAFSVAETLFGNARSTVVVNMSEFQERHTTSRLIGSPPGYVGYGEGGLLTEAVRQRPYSAVLLEESEKAHLDVMNLFYQVFDKGVLVDGEGKQVDFSNTVIFLTSNLAADVIAKLTEDGQQVDEDALMAAVRPILSKHFKPALLARMTVIPYAALTREALGTIVRMKLEKIGKEFMSQSKLGFSYSEAALSQIADRCTEVETGARNIDFILSKHVMPRMADEILSRMGSDASAANIAIDVDENGEFLVTLNDENRQPTAEREPMESAQAVASM
jgi:type VI secretion system protein VasG